MVRAKVLWAMSRNPPRLRCAIYTRKSTEEGLDQEFNSLDAQREACVAYIASQVGLGWKLVPDPYDDGGISGGTMERPALQRLLQDTSTPASLTKAGHPCHAPRHPLHIVQPSARCQPIACPNTWIRHSGN